MQSFISFWFSGYVFPKYVILRSFKWVDNNSNGNFTVKSSWIRGKHSLFGRYTLPSIAAFSNTEIPAAFIRCGLSGKNPSVFASLSQNVKENDGKSINIYGFFVNVKIVRPLYAWIVLMTWLVEKFHPYNVMMVL